VAIDSMIKGEVSIKPSRFDLNGYLNDALVVKFYAI